MGVQDKTPLGGSNRSNQGNWDGIRGKLNELIEAHNVSVSDIEAIADALNGNIDSTNELSGGFEGGGGDTGPAGPCGAQGFCGAAGPCGAQGFCGSGGGGSASDVWSPIPSYEETVNADSVELVPGETDVIWTSRGAADPFSIDPLFPTIGPAITPNTGVGTDLGFFFITFVVSLDEASFAGTDPGTFRTFYSSAGGQQDVRSFSVDESARADTFWGGIAWTIPVYNATSGPAFYLGIEHDADASLFPAYVYADIWQVGYRTP